MSNESNHIGPEKENEDLQDFLKRSEEIRLPEFSRNKSKVWEKIDERTSTDTSKIYYWMAAAVVIIAFGLWWIPSFIGNSQEQFNTAFAEQETVLLPDESTVSLNAESSISFDPNWNERTIELIGEAFFEVIEGEKFTVETEFGSVTVLGTSFNVLSRDSQFSVACKSGSVRVAVPSLQYEKILKPGDFVELDSGKIKFYQRKLEQIASWQTGEFYFENRPISEVFEEMERQFNVSINLQGLKGARFTGYFANEDLTTALMMVCEPMELSYGIISDAKVDIRPRSNQ